MEPYGMVDIELPRIMGGSRFIVRLLSLKRKLLARKAIGVPNLK
jgi:hypothetical protein